MYANKDWGPNMENINAKNLRGIMPNDTLEIIGDTSGII